MPSLTAPTSRVSHTLHDLFAWLGTINQAEHLVKGCCYGLALSATSAWHAGRFDAFARGLYSAQHNISFPDYPVSELLYRIAHIQAPRCYQTGLNQSHIRQLINIYSSPALSKAGGIHHVHQVIGRYDFNALANHIRYLADKAGTKNLTVLFGTTSHIFSAIWTGHDWIVTDSVLDKVTRFSSHEALRDHLAYSLHGCLPRHILQNHHFVMSTTLVNSDIKVTKQKLTTEVDSYNGSFPLDLAARFTPKLLLKASKSILDNVKTNPKSRMIYQALIESSMSRHNRRFIKSALKNEPTSHPYIQWKNSLIFRLTLTETTQPKTISLACEFGFPVNKRSKLYHGMTPLMMAFSRNKPLLVKALLDNGANPNLVDNCGLSIVSFSVGTHDPALVRLALASKKDYAQMINDCIAALPTAIHCRDYEIVLILLEKAKARLSHPDLTVLAKQAFKTGDCNIARLIMSHMPHVAPLCYQQQATAPVRAPLLPTPAYPYVAPPCYQQQPTAPDRVPLLPTPAYLCPAPRIGF